MSFLGTLAGEGSLAFSLLVCFAFSGNSPAWIVTRFYLLKRTESLGIMFITYNSFTFSVDDNYL